MISKSFYLLLVETEVDSNDPEGAVVIGSTGSTGEVENCLGEISSLIATIKMKNKNK